MFYQINTRHVLQNSVLVTVVMVNLLYFTQMTYGAAAHGTREQHGHKPNSDRDKHLKERIKHPANKILGSKKEVETFEQMSPEVAKARLRELASKMDRNVDGKIEKKELQVGYTLLQVSQNLQSYLGLSSPAINYIFIIYMNIVF